jgi:acyl-CoA reductase-like NAD-dependent aldehyde dehydrogenase
VTARPSPSSTRPPGNFCLGARSLVRAGEPGGERCPARFAQWSRTTPASRSTLLLRLADAIERHAEEFAALESLNCGKPYLAVLNDELPAVVDCFRFFAGAARCLQAAGGEYIEGHTSMIRRDPIGVVGIAPGTIR